MTVETVETVVVAAPYVALIGHKLRPLLSDSQSALADCEEDVIQICHLLLRNGKLSLVRLTKSFPTIPNLIGIVNSNQNDERLKMWSVMLLCTIEELNAKDEKLNWTIYDGLNFKDRSIRMTQSVVVIKDFLSLN